MTNSIYINVQTVWVLIIERTVSLLAVFFRVILVDVCNASYCGYTWTDYVYKTDTEIAEELNITPGLDKM